MTIKRSDSFEEFQRKKAARHAVETPPLTHNQPADLPSLSHEEFTAVDAARDALAAMKRTFEFWIVIGRALKVLKDKADRLGGRFTFDRLREREGLGGKRRDGTDVLNKTRVSRLLAIVDSQPEVETWRQKLTDRQRFDWSSPEAVYRHCPVFAKATPEDEKLKLTPMGKLKQEVIRLEEENHTLKQREDGDRFKPTDTAKDIATTLVGMFRPSKAQDIAKQMLDLIKKRTKAETSLQA